jgi:uncharacterized protein YacL
MKIIIFFLNRVKVVHKLLYSKTMKSDVIVAFVGLLLSLFVAYLSLNSIVGSSIDIYDLCIFF